MKKLFIIMKKLSEKRFAELHSDWPKLFFGSHALVRGYTNLCLYNSIPIQSCVNFLKSGKYSKNAYIV